MWTRSKPSFARGSTLLLLLLSALQSTLFSQQQAVDAFLFPVIPPSKLIRNRSIVLQKKQIKCKLQKRRKALFLKRKKKQQKKTFFLAKGAAMAAVGVAGATAATATVATAAAVVALNNVEPAEIYTPVVNSLNGQSILITGGTTGLGLETAKRLAMGSPDNLIITARSAEKGQSAIDKIYKHMSVKGVESDSTSISYKVLDLDDVQGIKDSVADWLQDESSPFPDQLDCIVNNAGVMAIPKLELTVDGIERQMSSNHLGHFVLTKLLSSKLSKRAKVINVSSTAHETAKPKGMEFDYCWTGSPNYSPWKSYGQSKLANILFSQELQRRSDDAGYEWDVACLHPGVIISTDLFARQPLGEENFKRLQDLQGTVEDNIPSSFKDGLDTLATKIGDLGLIKTIEQGATTSVWLASGAYKSGDDDVRTNAQYYDNCKPKSLDDFARDVDAAQRLWEESEERGNITFDLFQKVDTDESTVETDNTLEDPVSDESPDESDADAEDSEEKNDDEDPEKGQEEEEEEGSQNNEDDDTLKEE